MALVVNQATFRHEVLGSSTPVLVNFWAPWCGLCRLVEPMLSKLQAEWGAQIKWVSINADENLKLANTYKLKTLPTVMLFVEGDLICRLDHFRSHDDFRAAAVELQATLETAVQCYDYSVSA
jgi:thioredoxin 1